MTEKTVPAWKIWLIDWLGKLLGVIVKELQENPSTLHVPFIELALGALKKAFPCRISN